MRVSGVSGSAMQSNATGMGSGIGGQMDEVSKDLQNQIQDLQKEMQELSSNQELSMEAKMNKRQELQQQISSLEVQLRQHQMEVKREATQKKQSSGNAMDEMLGTKNQNTQNKGQSTGLSAGSMEALLSADASMKQASVQGSTARKLEGKANVIEGEIKMDAGGAGGSNIEAKEAELAEMRDAAQQATASQMQSLAQAGKTLQEAGDDEKTEDKTKKSDKTSEKTDGTATTEEGENTEKAGNIGEGGQTNTFDDELPGVTLSRGYNPVDVRV